MCNFLNNQIKSNCVFTVVFGGSVAVSSSFISFCSYCVAALQLGGVECTPKSRGGHSLV